MLSIVKALKKGDAICIEKYKKTTNEEKQLIFSGNALIERIGDVGIKAMGVKSVHAPGFLMFDEYGDTWKIYKVMNE